MGTVSAGGSFGEWPGKAFSWFISIISIDFKVFPWIFSEI